MEQQRWQKIKNLFDAASDLPTHAQLSFVQTNAAHDTELASQVLRMLEKDAEASFLDSGAASLAAQVLEEEAPQDQALADSEALPYATIGPCRLLRKLGSGGMGVVYLAERTDWQSKVALKIPRDIWISHDRQKRFADEQRLLARLIHPSIARIYEGGTLPNATPWFAMEYVDGEPITTYCQSRHSSVSQRLHLFLAVCDAVQYAHTQTIIHRDLKPSNILVTPSGDVKLLDFGIAKQLGDSFNTHVDTRIGHHPVTLAYAAPEQILLNNISTQSDIYSLGVILYQLLTAALPFDLSNLTPSQAEEIIRTQEPEKPSAAARKSAQSSSLDQNFPQPGHGEWADLNVLVLTAMHRDVAKRYGSVDALRRDIHRYLQNQPLEARPDTLTYRCAKFLKRRRVPVLLSAAALALLLGLVAYYSVRLARARDAAFAEAARTRLAREFTGNLLAGGDQEIGPSKDLRVIDLLERGVKKAATLRGDPLQQGQLYTTLGSLYMSLGDYPQAGSLLHSSYRILSSAAPQSHELAEDLVDLGLVYSAQAQPQHAAACIRKGLAIEQSISPPDARLIFKYKTALAFVFANYDPPSAIAILQGLMKEPAGMADQEARSDVLGLLETSLLDLGRYQEAEPFTRQVLAYDQRTRPANHPDIASELINLASIQYHQRQFKESERTLRQALAIDQGWFPAGHPEIADVKRILAETLFEEGRFSEASQLGNQALFDQQRAYGNLHPLIAFTLQILGRLAFERGSLNQAEQYFNQEIATLRTFDDKVTLPVALSYLGDVYLRKESYRQAQAAYRQSVALFPRSPREHSAQLATTNRKLAEALLLQRP